MAQSRLSDGAAFTNCADSLLNRRDKSPEMGLTYSMAIEVDIARDQNKDYPQNDQTDHHLTGAYP
jgi:hypothetical protein